MHLFTSLRRLSLMAALLASSLGSAWAQAPASSLSLVFTEPTGVVGPTDSIPVNLRFTNNDPTLEFIVDNSLPNMGLDLAMLPTTGQYYDEVLNETFYDVPFVSYTGAYLGTGFGCSGTFTAAGQCTEGPPYTFEWGPFAPFGEPFHLAPGASVDYLFGTFVPSAGPVAAGTYEFYRSVAWLNVYGLDAEGHQLWGYNFPAMTCNGDSAEQCANTGFFSRVVAVPEPGSYALMALGLALVGWRARRQIATR